MDYTARIEKLRAYKSSMSSGELTNSVASFSSLISEWHGGKSQEGYYGYSNKIRQDSRELVSQRNLFLADIEARIQELEEKIASEYSSYQYILSANYTKDPLKNRQLKINQIRSLNVDSSVKQKLLRGV